MHNNQNGDKQNSKMMWIMMLCCAVPLLLIILFGLGGRAFGASTWVIFGGMALMVIAHFFMMGKSHKHGVDNEEDQNKDGKNNKTHSGHGCCH